MSLEKIKIRLIIEDFHFQETPFQGPGERVQEEETGDYYLRKYLITTQPFNYRNKEYSQLAVYSDSYLDFEGISSVRGDQPELKKYLWELQWWEGDGYPGARINQSQKRIILAQNSYLPKFEKFRLAENSLAVSPTENGSSWDEKSGRLTVKIKPVKIEERIEVNQLDFCVGKFFGEEVRQVIFANFRPGKLVNIYFNEKRFSGPCFELAKEQTKLVIFPSDLKNEFGDYSWFSTTDDSNPSEDPPRNRPNSPLSPPSNHGGKWFLAILLGLSIITLACFYFSRQIGKKKKK